MIFFLSFWCIWSFLFPSLSGIHLPHALWWEGLMLAKLKDRLRESCSSLAVKADWAQWDDHRSQTEPIEQTSYRFQQWMSAVSEVTRQLKDIVADSREHKGWQEPAGLGLRLPSFCCWKVTEARLSINSDTSLKKNSGLEDIKLNIYQICPRF